jgi:hypothetical protein
MFWNRGVSRSSVPNGIPSKAAAPAGPDVDDAICHVPHPHRLRDKAA